MKESTRQGRKPSDDDTDDEQLYADAVPGRYVAEVLCPTLPQRTRRTLGMLALYVSIDDLFSLRAVETGQRPDLDETDAWCKRTLGKPLDFYAKTLPCDQLRGILTGYDAKRAIALATLDEAAGEAREWAVLAVKKLRDRNTVARAEGRRSTRDLALPVSELIKLGATDAELAALPTADESSQALSVKIIESWTAADRRDAGKPAPTTVTITLTRASEVERKHIDWLWTTEQANPYVCGISTSMIPLHGLTLLAGREGSGKSTMCWWLTAQITHGLLPGHYEGRSRDVVIFASEDSRSKIRAKLEAEGADIDRVHFPDVKTSADTELRFSIRDHLDVLAAVLQDIEPGLVIFDPLKDFLGDLVNTDREDEVRPILTPLLALTQECGAAVVGLHHLNKGTRGDFLTRLTGSGAFKNVARSVLGVAHDATTGMRLVQLMKSNDAELTGTAFQARIEGADITIDGRTEKVGKWVMDGVSLVDLDTVLTAKEQGDRTGSATERAKDALEKYLGDEAKPSDEVKEAVAVQLGISEITVKRAFREMGGLAERTKERGSRTMWRLPIQDNGDD